MALFQFVDSIASSPTVRLDLNSGVLRVSDEGLDLSPPPLRRARVSTLLTHGQRIPASAWDNRMLKLPLQLVQTTVDAAGITLQQLARELVRESNILRMQLGTVPVFFRTFPAPDYAFGMPKLLVQYGKAVLGIPAEPFAYGLPETLSPVIISNDPADRFPLNANPYFETDASNWTPAGGTFARSTAQFHQGAASGLLTPDGVSVTAIVRSELCPNLLEGFDHRASAWVRCAVARNVVIGIDWHDHTGAFVSSSTATVAVAANTWTFIDVVGVAPSVGGPGDLPQAKVTVSMTGTPLASHLLHVDEAKLRDQESGNGPGGLCWDITGVKGDVETPPVMSLTSAVFTADRQIALAVRRGSTVSLPLVVEAEVVPPTTAGVDTTAQTGDAVMSRGMYFRTTFATQPTMVTRLTTAFGAVGSGAEALRGRYRVMLRYRKTVASDVIRVQLKWVGTVVNAAVTLPASTQIRYADLGVITVPAFNDPVSDGLSGIPLPVGGMAIEVQAARDSGTGNFDQDCLVFVPAAGPVGSPGSDRMALVTIPALSVGPPVEQAVIDAANEQTYTRDLFGLTNERPMPVDGLYPLLSPGVTNRMVLLANAGLIGPADSILDTVEVAVTYWPRYLNVRPVST